MKPIPTQKERPDGFHIRYLVLKIDKDGNFRETDPGSEYFVARLDEGGRDKEHTKACRIAVKAYTDAIEHYLPQVAIDLRERYPIADTHM
jgi:hypothetical protein